MKIVMAAVLVMCAFSAAAASSASAGWLVGGKELVNTHIPIMPLPILHANPVLHVVVPGSPATLILIECLTFHIINGTLLPPNLIHADEIIFLHCFTTAPTPSNCKLTENDLLKEIKTVALLGTARKQRIDIKPVTGKLFTSVPFQETTCALSGEEPVQGSVTLGIPNSGTESLNQLFIGLGSEENNSLQIGNTGAKGFLLGAALLLLENDSKWSFD